VALRRSGDAVARRYGLALVGLLLWQLASGLSNVVLGWPIAAALAHSAGAAVLVAVLTSLWARLRQPAGVTALAATPPTPASQRAATARHASAS
jgi:cytochrome c oxidase assembly protein subunit 15